jgi:hypothetical protein
VFAPEASYGFPVEDGGVTKLAARNKIGLINLDG